ncbi:hypothetical protein ASG11_14305 [Sphingomonas sp. Leaf357]|uniref:DUF535 family protein n=1 Tax=Sphingomonas sp. Leaf357 TaxID=1736350 RepID=UPI0006F8D0BF|nr:DUF535 family protein [Sphingomonas sp. Leaf357]KQS01982.1 hypothetical protein ASG11_14305 [Sphingomonas sp. Leaf357]
MSVDKLAGRMLPAWRKRSALGVIENRVPDLWVMAARPLISSNWNLSKRFLQIRKHFAVIRQTRLPLVLEPNQYIDLFSFDLGEHSCRVMLDQPSWLLRDGLLTISLWVDIDRIFSMSFCLSDRGGERVAYVGGIQGRRHATSLDLNRALTKAAHGLRPRDLMFELFRLFCETVGAKRILCVSNATRCNTTHMERGMPQAGAPLLDYDEVWRDRGGVLGPDGFFQIPIARRMRSEAEIPARKRGLYAKRYQFIAQLQPAMTAALSSSLQVKTHRTSVHAR